MESNKRIDWIDIAKGIAILLVIIGHLPRDLMREKYISINFVYQLIYTFHMPLFFFLSGYIYKLKNRNTDKFYIKKIFVKLMIPWLLYSFFMYIVIIVINYIPIIGNMVSKTNMKVIPISQYIYDMFTGNNPYAFHLWFIYVLFIFNVIVYFIEKKFVKHTNLMYFCLIVLNVLIYAFFYKKLLVDLICKNLIYFIFGILYKKKEFHLNFNFIYIGLFYNGLLFFINKLNVNIILLKILLIIELLISIPIIILSIVSISKKIGSHFLKYMGKNSYNYYLLHQPFCCGFVGMILLKVFNHSYINFLIVMLICFFTSIIVPFFILIIISITKSEKIFKKLLNIKYYKYEDV